MAKEVKKPAKKSAAAGGRTRKLTKKQQKAKAKQQTRQRVPLPSSFKLIGQVFGIFRKYWKTLGGIVVVYFLMNVIFASGISNVSANFSTIKTDLQTNGGHGLWHAAGGFAALVGSSGSSGSPTATVLQSMLFVLESLVIIWTLRHLLSGQSVTVKLAYYRSTTPLIPFLLVLAVIIIQLLPMTIGGYVLGIVSTSVFTDSGVATAFSAVAFGLLTAWSIYMVSASIFGAYIVTLPDIEPRQALRSARDLVRFRRLTVLRKVLFLPIFLLAAMAVIMVPLILYVSWIVPTVFYVLSMLAILFVHTYLYSLYRGLIA